LSAYLNNNLRHDGTAIRNTLEGSRVVIIRWSYLPSFLPVQRRWKLLQLAIFFAFASGTYIDPAVRLPVAIFVQAPVLILVCGFLAYVATSILVWLSDWVGSDPRLLLRMGGDSERRSNHAGAKVIPSA
jgi:hypothetical protein